MGKRATLSGLTHKKPAAETVKPTPSARASADDTAPTKGLIVRLSPPAWKQVKQLALDKETSIHSLLLEGVNHVFEKNGLPPIA